MCKILGVPVTQLNLKNVFLYEIGLIAIREVSPPSDEEQQYWRPYQPKHSPGCLLRKLHKIIYCCLGCRLTVLPFYRLRIIEIMKVCMYKTIVFIAMSLLARIVQRWFR